MLLKSELRNKKITIEEAMEDARNGIVEPSSPSKRLPADPDSAITKDPDFEVTVANISEAKHANEFDSIWECIQIAYHATSELVVAAPWSKEEEQVIWKATEVIQQQIGRDKPIPLSYLLHKLEHVEVLTQYPFPIRVLTHLTNFQSAPQSELELFRDSVVNKLQRMQEKQFATFFQDFILEFLVKSSNDKIEPATPAIGLNTIAADIVATPVHTREERTLCIDTTKLPPKSSKFATMSAEEIDRIIACECPYVSPYKSFAPLDEYAHALLAKHGMISWQQFVDLERIGKVRSIHHSHYISAAIHLLDLQGIRREQLAQFLENSFLSTTHKIHVMDCYFDRTEGKNEAWEHLNDKTSGQLWHDLRNLSTLEAIVCEDKLPFAYFKKRFVAPFDREIYVAAFNNVDWSGVSDEAWAEVLDRMNPTTYADIRQYYERRYKVLRLFDKIRTCPDFPSWTHETMANLEAHAESLKKQYGTLTWAQAEQFFDPSTSLGNIDARCVALNLIDSIPDDRVEWIVSRFQGHSEAFVYYVRRKFGVKMFRDMDSKQIWEKIRTATTDTLKLEEFADNLKKTYGPITFKQYKELHVDCATWTYRCIVFNLLDVKDWNAIFRFIWANITDDEALVYLEGRIERIRGEYKYESLDEILCAIRFHLATWEKKPGDVWESPNKESLECMASELLKWGVPRLTSNQFNEIGELPLSPPMLMVAFNLQDLANTGILIAGSWIKKIVDTYPASTHTC